MPEPTKSRTPNYDDLHRTVQVKIDRDVVDQLHGYKHAGPAGRQTQAVRRPTDIDLFRELYAIKYKAERMARSLAFMAKPKAEQEVQLEKDRENYKRRYRTDLPPYLRDLPSRRKMAEDTLVANRIL